MKTKYLILFIISVYSNPFFGQQSINDYKYVIVPNKFDFLKHENQYKINEYTLFQMRKTGFIVLKDDEIRPDELSKNPCLGLSIKVSKKSAFLYTKLFFTLKNCKNEIVFTSTEGKNKIKDYERAYQACLRDAFKSLNSVNYNYSPSKNNVITNKVLGKKSVIEIPIVKKTVVDTSNEKPLTIAKKEVKKLELKPNLKVKTPRITKTILYAQKNELGFQLVDNTPKIIHILLKTSIKNTFLFKHKKGILYQKDGKWISEIYVNNKLQIVELDIKGLN
jgi:hypothetical protein